MRKKENMVITCRCTEVTENTRPGKGQLTGVHILLGVQGRNSALGLLGRKRRYPWVNKGWVARQIKLSGSDPLENRQLQRIKLPRSTLAEGATSGRPLGSAVP